MNSQKYCSWTFSWLLNRSLLWLLVHTPEWQSSIKKLYFISGPGNFPQELFAVSLGSYWLLYYTWKMACETVLWVLRNSVEMQVVQLGKKKDGSYQVETFWRRMSFTPTGGWQARCWPRGRKEHPKSWTRRCCISESTYEEGDGDATMCLLLLGPPQQGPPLWEYGIVEGHHWTQPCGSVDMGLVLTTHHPAHFSLGLGYLAFEKCYCSSNHSASRLQGLICGSQLMPEAQAWALARLNRPSKQRVNALHASWRLKHCFAHSFALLRGSEQLVHSWNTSFEQWKKTCFILRAKIIES